MDAVFKYTVLAARILLQQGYCDLKTVSLLQGYCCSKDTLFGNSILVTGICLLMLL
jgi:hypothetical protein